MLSNLNDLLPPTPSLDSDKRLLVIESEFSNVLQNNKREGNILSAVIRDAWDGKDLQQVTKNNPLKATAPHIAIIGHTTSYELKSLINQREIWNGFANRFIFIYATRSKLLPNAPSLEESDISEISKQLGVFQKFLITNQQEGSKRITMDNEASELWTSLYHELSMAEESTVGTLLARSEAHVTRFAMIYAILDCSPQIKKVHLEAAYALWQYAEESIRYIFKQLPEETKHRGPEQKVLHFLAAQANKTATRNQISKTVFQRNKTAIEINHLRNDLVGNNLIRVENTQKEELWTLN